ncbi:NADPH-dependent FMN reductase [Lactobacillus terrae]|uniref:NADPH-dependent FMN reductase n=1 Tax=Lactobacillus terrae TaxID=2269374 RepID=UPI000C1B67CB|nr:NAD(P)H-dependent oxidoreductase [Lactobacillus terrae]
MKKIGLIVGSTRSSRAGLKIAHWVMDNFHSDILEVELIDLKELNLPQMNEKYIPAFNMYELDETKKWSAHIKSLDGVIFLFPQYNWGYPAPLKNAIDYLYSEWKNKPAATIVYGMHNAYQAELAFSLVMKGLEMDILNSRLAMGYDIKSPLDPAETFSDKVVYIENIVKEFEQKLK